jgi:hypothetical protein
MRSHPASISVGKSRLAAPDELKLRQYRAGNGTGIDVVPVECDVALQLAHPF